jgi:hypothetical protein
MGEPAHVAEPWRLWLIAGDLQRARKNELRREIVQEMIANIRDRFRVPVSLPVWTVER